MIMLLNSKERGNNSGAILSSSHGAYVLRAFLVILFVVNLMLAKGTTPMMLAVRPL